MIVRNLIVPLTVAAFAMQTAASFAQGAFPAPLPGQQAAPAASPFPPVGGSGAPASGGGASPFPPVGGAQSSPFPPVSGGAPSPFPSAGAPPVAGGGFSQRPPGPPAGGEACMQEFVPLRQEAEKRGQAIQKASERKASPVEACRLIGLFAQSEAKMIRFIETNRERCGIPPEVAKQMRDGQKGTEKMRTQVCQVAQQVQQQQRAGAAAAPTLSDVLGSSAALPEVNTGRRRGGSTFDTLTGNALNR